jgi:hypothetical protein
MNPNLKSISIVILNWNGLPYLQKFIPGVLGNSNVEGFFTQVVVADNGSTDGSLEWIASTQSNVKTIALNKNYGFAEGYNRALAQIDADYYVTLNSDVEVGEGWLHPLIHFLESTPEAAACQPKIISYNEPNKFEYAGAAGGYIDFLGYPFCRGRILSVTEEDHGQYNTPSKVFWTSGACMLIKSHAFWAAGGFDGDFFAHMEEIDLCWRLNRLGYTLWCIPQSSVLHVGGGTLPNNNPFKVFLNHRNNLLMLQKNLFGARLFLTLSLRIILDWLSMFLYFVSGKGSFAKSVIKAHVQFFKMWRVNASKKKPLLSYTSAKELLYPRSILLQFFLMRRKNYSQLNHD